MTFREALEKINSLNPEVDSDEGYNEWGEAHCFRQAQEIAGAVLKTSQPETEALALLRELNDALVIPGWLQPRVDAVLDRADGEGKPAVGSEANALRAELECYRKALNRIIADGECDAVQVAHEAITPYVPWQKVSPGESARLDAAVGIKHRPQKEKP